jgi:hypothetical protein
MTGPELAVIAVTAAVILAGSLGVLVYAIVRNRRRRP